MIKKLLLTLCLLVTLVASASAQFTFPVAHFSTSVAGAFPSSVNCDLDVTQADSYFSGTIDNAAAVDKGGGKVGIPITGHSLIDGEIFTIAGTTNYNADEAVVSQTANEVVITATFVSETFGGSETVKSQEWKNLIGSPNDSSLQTSYDAFRGVDNTASTDDPSPSGSGTSAGKFDVDGGDFLTFQSITGNSLSHSGQTSGSGSGPQWIAFVFSLGGVGTATKPYGSGNTDRIQVVMNLTNLRFQQQGSGLFNEEIIGTGTFNATDEFLMILTWDTTNTGGERSWINSTTGSNWTTAYSPFTETSELTAPFGIGASDAGSFPLLNLSEIFAISCGNSILTDAEAANMFTLYGARRDTDYTI